MGYAGGSRSAFVAAGTSVIDAKRPRGSGRVYKDGKYFLMLMKRHASIVQLLAAANPVGLDLIVPAIPQLGERFPHIGSQELFSYYLFGLGVGQIGAAFLLQKGKGYFLSWSACIIYVVSALSAALAGDGASLLASRFVSGLAAGSLYFICVWMITAENNKEEAATLYAKRNTALLLAAGVVPLISAGVVLLVGWKSVFLLQAAYGIGCAAVLPQFARALTVNTSAQERFTLSGFARMDAVNIACMISFSLLLYVCLSNLPAVLIADGHDSSPVLSVAIIMTAIAYRTGAVARKKRPLLLSRLFPLVVIVLFALSSASASAWAHLDIYLYVSLYLFAGLYQPGQASTVLTRPFFRQPLATGILTSISLIVSVLAIETAHRFEDWRMGLWATVAFAILVITVSAIINSLTVNRRITAT